MKILPKEIIEALKKPTNLARLEKTAEGVNLTVNDVILESRKIEWNNGNCVTCSLGLEVTCEDVRHGFAVCSFCNTFHYIERTEEEIAALVNSSVPGRNFKHREFPETAEPS